MVFIKEYAPPSPVSGGYRVVFLSFSPFQKKKKTMKKVLASFHLRGLCWLLFFFPLPYIQLLAFFNSLHTWRGSGRRRRRMGEEEGELRNVEAREKEEEEG